MNRPLSIIRARRCEIAAIQDSLSKEDRDLAVAENVLARLEGDRASSGVQLPMRDAEPPPQGAPRSQRDIAINVLRRSDSVWLSTRDVVAEAKQRWAVEIPEASLRPLLTVLKKEGVIERDGRVVALRERLERNIAALSQPAPQRKNGSRKR